MRWVKVRLKDGGELKGLLMSRPKLAASSYLTLKLESGYNVGIEEAKVLEIEELGPFQPGKTFEPPSYEAEPDRPLVSILATGGTIASRVDYLTGGVRAAFTAEELVAAVPELSRIANLRGRRIFNKFSENINPGDWITLAGEVAKEIREGCSGVVITHGTDTMHYTSAALAFMLRSPVPIVLTGAQRSSDRGSSDAAFNLLCATRVATCDFGEVCIVMHASMSDDLCAILPATRARKLHASRRDAFKAVGSPPLGWATPTEAEFVEQLRKGEKLELDAKLEEKVALLKFYPGMGPKILERLVELNYRGIVLEGTGMGHVSEQLFQAIREAIERGTFVAMTSQTIYGRVNMYVYATGRELLELGVMPCEDMLPEVAYVKLMWVLAHTRNPERVREMMLTNYAREITERSRPDPQPLLQNGL